MSNANDISTAYAGPASAPTIDWPDFTDDGAVTLDPVEVWLVWGMTRRIHRALRRGD